MTDGEIDSEFEEVWLHYPWKAGKGSARRTYRKWRKSGKLPPKETLILIIENMKRRRRSWLAGFIQRFATFLNDEGWLDEQDPEKKKGEWIDGEWHPF